MGLCGFLEQQGDKALLKTWRRRWFQQKGDFLFYFHARADTAPINYISLQRLEAPVKLSAGSTTRFELRVRPDHDALPVVGGGVAQEFTYFRLRAGTPEDAQYWLTGLNDLLRQQAVKAKNAILSAHALPPASHVAPSAKRDGHASRLTAALTAVIGPAVGSDVLLAIEREVTVALAERDTDVAAARADVQLLLAELSEARHAVTRLADALGAAKAQQLLSDATSAPIAAVSLPLSSETLRRPVKPSPALPARGKPTVLARRHDPLRVYDRAYVAALEKELLDTREELDDLKQAIDETESTISTLKKKFPHLQSANINLGAKLQKAPAEPWDNSVHAPIDGDRSNEHGNDDEDNLSSATLEAYVVWRSTMTDAAIDLATKSATELPTVTPPAAARTDGDGVVDNDDDDDEASEYPPPPLEDDASDIEPTERPIPPVPVARVAPVAPAKPTRLISSAPAVALAAPLAAPVAAPASRPTVDTSVVSPRTSGTRSPPLSPKKAPVVAMLPAAAPLSPRLAAVAESRESRALPRKPLPQLPPQTQRTSTTEHANAPAPLADKEPAAGATATGAGMTEPSAADLEMARQAASKPLPAVGGNPVTLTRTGKLPMPKAQRPVLNPAPSTGVSAAPLMQLPELAAMSAHEPAAAAAAVEVFSSAGLIGGQPVLQYGHVPQFQDEAKAAEEAAAAAAQKSEL
jgi:hypothetical protein